MGTFGDRLLDLIADYGVSQSDLARSIEVSTAAISTMISGRTNPSKQTIKLICDTYGCSREWLVDGTGPMYSSDPASRQIAEYLGHAITHNTTRKDSFLRAAAGASEDTLSVLESWLLEYAEQVRSRGSPGSNE